jgi:AraC-like DNA-binding protein
MIVFGPFSLTLLIAAAQGVVLAVLLWRRPHNRAANRDLALLIAGVALLMVPYIIGYAGFYDAWPALSFLPCSVTMAFGPLLLRYAAHLTGTPAPGWRHLLPALAQWLADALVFPLPLATKNWWDGVANAPYVSPAFELGALVSIGIYGGLAWRRYRAYRHWLAENRSDGVDCDPAWLRNFLAALAGIALVWAGFNLADALDPSRNYFDRFGLYLGFGLLVMYLGIEGWRHADQRFPAMVAAAPAAAEPGRDWAAMGSDWLARIDAERLWQNPDVDLAGLARHFGTNTAYLSRGLNAAAGENFNAIINRRRVAFVQAQLQANRARGDMMGLAFDAGFRSKASFNRAFADFAGMSPTQFRLKSQKSGVMA